jgi:hypothetical protein
MDFAPIADQRTALLAAGGHNGRIAVFGIESGMCARPSTETKEVEASGPMVSSKEESPDEACEPLLSWKGSSGWISQVHFLSQQPQVNMQILQNLVVGRREFQDCRLIDFFARPTEGTFDSHLCYTNFQLIILLKPVWSNDPHTVSQFYILFFRVPHFYSQAQMMAA